PRHLPHRLALLPPPRTHPCPLSLHDALPIYGSAMPVPTQLASAAAWQDDAHAAANRRLYQEKFARVLPLLTPLMSLARTSPGRGDRKSTRLNSSHQIISYAVFCLKKKTQSSM